MTTLGPTTSNADLPPGLIEEILGYLNLSSGSGHPAFADNLNRLCDHLGGVGCWSEVGQLLAESLRSLSDDESVSTLADSEQADAVLELVFDGLIPLYRMHHADLLFHLADPDWEHPFLLVKMFEAVLGQGPEWDDTTRILEAALDTLNDFLGYRPVAVLENDQFCEPYPNERYRPVPIFLAGAGASAGPYRDLVARTIEVLEGTPGDLLTVAHFNPSHLDELAVDVRAHDHLHPVNKRTTYMFGEWDHDSTDTKGFFRRFILRQVILDALIDWTRSMTKNGADPSEVLEDSAIVLAGTVLMASAISGAGPDTHDSTVSLTTLLPVVARLRDAFYEHHVQLAEGKRAEMLIELAAQTQQPFGHVRQQLNLYLARYGAHQIQHRQLALLYARMGFPEAARQQAESIPAASIRFECEIQCALTATEMSAERGDLLESLEHLSEARDLLDRGIDCGALPDPWNYLGFQAQFPLFHAREDVIPDSRLEDLLTLMERLFAAYGTALSEAAARGHNDLVNRLNNDFQALALNWDGYGASIVVDLDAESGVRRWWSASQAAHVLATWQSAGAARGDLAFWAEQVKDFSNFQAGPAYAQIVDALLDRRDLPATMGLLMQWLNQAVPGDLATSPTSIAGLLNRWIDLATDPAHIRPSPEHTRLVERFFAVLEANAESYWSVPRLDEELTQLAAPSHPSLLEELLGSIGLPDDETSDEPGMVFDEPFEGDDEPGENPEFENGMGNEFEEGVVDDDDDDLSEDDTLFSAAYDDVTFRDSADDGFDAELLDEGYLPGATEFESLYRELVPRLRFLESIARLWQQLVAGAPLMPDLDPDKARSWTEHARTVQEELLGLLDAIWQHPIPTPSAQSDSGIEFDIQLQTKYELLQLVMAVHVQARRAELMLRGLLPTETTDSDRREHRLWRLLTGAVIHGDTATIRQALPVVLRRLARQPLLYVPLDAGGDPHSMLAARTRHADLQFLVEHLPKLGLLRETSQVLRTAYRMERTSRPDGAAVTEFDRLFRLALRHTLEAVCHSVHDWPQTHARRPRRDIPGTPPRQKRPRPRYSRRDRRPDRRRSQSGLNRDQGLLQIFGQLVDRFQVPWLRHSSRTRLAAAEAIEPEDIWEDVREFIANYGSELFAAPKLTLGHIRTILHQGTDWLLEHLESEVAEDPLAESLLVNDLQAGNLDREQASHILQVIYQTIIDRYYRFIEYNTTTTQSDYGDKIHCLLDFLRLEAAYDRDAWNFAPSEIAHEVLAQGPRPWLATAWEEICGRGVRQHADGHLQRLAELESLWGMRLPGLTDRLAERFLRPLAVNRMRALVEAARADARAQRFPSMAFAQLQVEVDRYLDETHGSGIDVPPWLQKLEQEIDRRPSPSRPRAAAGLTPRAIAHQLATWQRSIMRRRRKRK
ncbi:MAG TPA: hypothetical protein DCE39_17575 [Planctomycetaceae bacterium]|nr:hypothetical protein [Planctomycetaceae bacterium]